MYGDVPPVALAVKVTVLPTQAIPEEATVAVKVAGSVMVTLTEALQPVVTSLVTTT